MPIHEGDVTNLGNQIEKLSIDVVSGKKLPPIADRDQKNIFFLLKNGQDCC
jgi:hypothetical protein